MTSEMLPGSADGVGRGAGVEKRYRRVEVLKNDNENEITT
jgi:hypothetical protein